MSTSVLSSGCLYFRCDSVVSGETLQPLADRLDTLLQETPTTPGVVCDFAAVQYLNSAGLGALFRALRELRGRGTRLVVCGAAPHVHRLLHAVGFDRVAGVTASVAEAEAQLSRASSAAGAPDQANP